MSSPRGKGCSAISTIRNSVAIVNAVRERLTADSEGLIKASRKKGVELICYTFAFLPTDVTVKNVEIKRRKLSILCSRDFLRGETSNNRDVQYVNLRKN